ncbi:PaaI family thioesterase [Anaerosporomusa subterranea]|uniref:PaaI family thioesterase n=1 Tax=Anaerosporomusa subterranea TaxID=1794912 RepID=UPI0009EEBE7F|nr:PaaI family thioesterase [Anaerosporomusa subterranea]
MHIAARKGQAGKASGTDSKDALDLAKFKEYLVNHYDSNPFVNLLKMSIADVGEGRVEITMPVIHDIHTNLYGVAHGGALASLADTAMGIACATLRKRVVTLELNINYIRGAAVQPAVKAIGVVVHNGSRTIVTECEILDQENALLAKARATFFIIGQFEGA